jgi:hypothetical protein
VDEVIRQIVEVARTGRMGDGKIFVLSTQSSGRAIDIATGGKATADRSSATAEKPATAKTASRRKSGKG